MHVDITHRPGNSAARVSLQPGETVTAEGGAMIAMSGNMNVQTTTHKRDQGSILGALKRLVTGESLFLNHFTAQGAPGEVFFGTALAGDMMQFEMGHGPAMLVQAGSYVASAPGVNMDMSWQGFGKALFSGESMFWIKLNGQGPVIINSFGAIYPIQVNGQYIVDTGHIVAFEESLNFEISKAGKSWLSSFLGGEGLVCKFIGQGTVWCQSHNVGSFGAALGPSLKPR
ncbi:MAG: TIGR00266 family protein [Verrucomicrobia subdivision 3 bacterium]|nr:TIGR00266 family protein [Limisphaerales bacterium]